MQIKVVARQKTGRLAALLIYFIGTAAYKFGASSSRAVSVNHAFIAFANKQRNLLNDKRAEEGLAKLSQYDAIREMGHGRVDVVNADLTDFARKLVNILNGQETEDGTTVQLTSEDATEGDGLECFVALARDWVEKHPSMDPSDIGIETAQAIISANAPVVATPVAA